MSINPYKNYYSFKKWSFHFLKRPFIHNIILITSGTAIAQIIAIFFSPLIARIYGANAYGVQGIFMSIANTMATIAAMTYPTAIVLPKYDADALAIARLSFYISIFTSGVTFFIIFYFKSEILYLLDSQNISNYIYFVPVFMLVSTASAVSNQWFIRKKFFSLTAKVAIFQASLVSIIKTCVGIVYPSAIVLIITNILSGMVNVLIATLNFHKVPIDIPKNELLPSNAWCLAKRHSDFLLYRAPQVLLNAISQSLPVMLLATFFGATAVGYYTLTLSVLAMPINLIGGSVSQVFYPRINEAIFRGEDVKSLIIKATLGLALIGVLPFAVIIFTGPSLFAFIFGSEWKTAGIYGQWLGVWLFFQYINKPAVTAIAPLQLQGGLLIYEIFSTGTKILALYIGYAVFGSEVTAIALFSIFGVIAYAWLISWVIFHSGKNIKVYSKK